MSSKAVEAFRLHPNRLKTLAPRGQGYLFFMGGEAERRWWWPFGATPTYGNGARPVNYAPMPALPQDWSHELPRNGQKEARGLRLYERFIKT